MSSNMSSSNGDVARDETASLISSDKVEGTSVYDAGGNSIGSIHSLMISKQEGSVSYAVLSFGGFLGIGANYYPVPWSTLAYSPDLGGYRTNLTKDVFEGAPSYETSADWYDRNRTWHGDVDAYYGRPGMFAP